MQRIYSYTRCSFQLKKLLSRSFSIFSDFLKKGINYSLKYSYYDLAYWIGFYSRNQHLCTKYTIKKQKWIDNYIYQNYKNLINKYSHRKESDQIITHLNIWVFWAQGVEKMPPLVKACYTQLLKTNSDTKGNSSVKFLDLQNINKFIQLPKEVFDKLNTGKLLYAHFSDILRNSLLAKYGGVWIDATCWTAHAIPEIAYKSIFFSPHNESDNTYWCTYLLGSNRIESVTFSFVRDMLIEFCLHEKVWPDYLLQDRLLDFAHRNISASKTAIDNTPTNSTRRFLLFPMMNKPFDNDFYNNLISTDWVFKLSYKSLYQKEVNGQETFYSKILNGSLN